MKVVMMMTKERNILIIIAILIVIICVTLCYSSLNKGNRDDNDNMEVVKLEEI